MEQQWRTDQQLWSLLLLGKCPGKMKFLLKQEKEKNKYQNLKDISELPKSRYNFILWKLVAQRCGPGQLKNIGFELQVTVVHPSQDKFPRVGNSMMVFMETN